MIADCTAIILAGGDSQRMGVDKANMLLGDQTLLQRVIVTMQKIFPHVIISVRQPRPEINLPQICDEQAGVGIAAGPLTGLAASMAHVTTPWAFAVACDMPFVAPTMVEYLAQQRAGNQAIVPIVKGYPQPLSAFYASNCKDAIREILEHREKKSLRAALGLLQVHYVDEAELMKVDPALRSFFDLDTPHDVALAMMHSI
jgi:molybdopterin-guanine dinucleotide biosynthesis protein A